MTLSPCLDCGTPADGTRCTDCTRTEQRSKPDRKTPPEDRGYDAAWKKLSRRARRLQRFCSDCGTARDLTADHSPEAWKAKAEGRPITLAMIDVLCRSCNARKGAAR